MPTRRAVISGQRAGRAAGALAQVFHHQQRREQVADLVGQLGVALDILAERRLLAAPLAVEELFGQELDRVALRRWRWSSMAPISGHSPMTGVAASRSIHPTIVPSSPGWTTGSP